MPMRVLLPGSAGGMSHHKHVCEYEVHFDLYKKRSLVGEGQ